MALFTVLSLPLPSSVRRPLIKAVSRPFQNREVTIAIRCILVFVLVLFVDSVNRVQSVNDELIGFSETQSGAVKQAFVSDRSEIQARKFYAQRNLYLTGFTLFLTLIVSRTYGLVAELLQLKDDVRNTPDAVQSDEKVKELLQKLKEKDENMDILKKQAQSLRADYETLSDEVAAKTKTAIEKKND
jgi:hypothetical protein